MGSCFPKDVTALKQLAGNCGLPLPAAELGDRGQRAAEAPRRAEAAEAPRAAGGQEDRACSASPSSRTPTTCARRRRSCCRRGCCPTARRSPRTTRSPRRRRASSSTASRSPSRRSGAIEDADAVVLVTEWPEFRDLDLAAVASAMRGSLIVDGRNYLDPAPCAMPGWCTRASAARAPTAPAAAPSTLMQALILAGGEGTRLRPLTSTVPKPVVPLVDRPFIAFMLEWLRGHGVDDVVMSCGFLASGVRNVLGDGSAYGMTHPLRRGAAAARHRRRAEVRGVAARRALPDAQRRRADRHGPDRPDRPARGDGRDGHAGADAGGEPVRLRAGAPRAGQRRCASSSRSRRPTRSTPTRSPPAPTCSSAACWTCCEPDQPASIERDVFPRLVGNGLYGHVSHGYWLDIGTPERYLEGTFDILEGTVHTEVQKRVGDGYISLAGDLESAGRVIPSAIVEQGCRIGADARVGGRVVLERGVTVGARTIVERAVVLQGAEIGDGLRDPRLHRRRRRADRRPLPHRGPGGARRGRDGRRRQRHRQRRAHLPRA